MKRVTGGTEAIRRRVKEGVRLRNSLKNLAG
jgi:hypothetical protein